MEQEQRALQWLLQHACGMPHPSEVLDRAICLSWWHCFSSVPPCLADITIKVWIKYRLAIQLLLIVTAS